MRFLIAILFVGSMTVFAADKPTAEEKAAMDYITQNRGVATLDSRLAPEARVHAKFEVVSDGILAGLKKYPQIGGIDSFDAYRCTDKGFAALKDLPHLRKLSLGKSNMTPASMAAIGQYADLHYLGLVNAGVTNVLLESLAKLTRLEHLILSDNRRITDKGLQTVKGFDRLQELYLSNTSITDKGLMELKVLDGLRILNVGGTGVTADAAEKFPDDMPNLRVVRR